MQGNGEEIDPLAVFTILKFIFRSSKPHYSIEFQDKSIVHVQGIRLKLKFTTIAQTQELTAVDVSLTKSYIRNAYMHVEFLINLHWWTNFHFVSRGLNTHFILNRSNLDGCSFIRWKWCSEKTFTGKELQRSSCVISMILWYWLCSDRKKCRHRKWCILYHISNRSSSSPKEFAESNNSDLYFMSQYWCLPHKFLKSISCEMLQA